MEFLHGVEKKSKTPIAWRFLSGFDVYRVNFDSNGPLN
jgi:hypothetical protein